MASLALNVADLVVASLCLLITLHAAECVRKEYWYMPNRERDYCCCRPPRILQGLEKWPWKLNRPVRLAFIVSIRS